MEEYEQRMEDGKGALGMRGALVDMPLDRQARQLLEKAQLIQSW
jgi:citrate lyase beta subunit